MSELWVELWTRPGHPNYGRLTQPQTANWGFQDGLNQVGAGNMALPSSWSDFDDILYTDPDNPANSQSSLVRVMSAANADPIFEWLPNSLVPAESKEDRLVEVTGVGMKGALGYARLEPWDWDGTDFYVPKVPDWVYGGNDIMENGGFETIPFTNGGFEDGNNNYWQITQADGFLTNASSVIAVNNPAAAETGDWYGAVDPISAKSGAARTFSGLTVGDTYTITGFLMDPSASGDRYRSGIQGASSASHTNAYKEDDYWWAELDNAPSGTGSSDGTWQTFTLTFVAGEESIQLVIIFDDAGAGPSFRIDTWAMTGAGVGLYPWEARYPTRTNTFQHDSANVHTGSGSVAVQGNDQMYTSPYGARGFGRIGIQQARVLKVGQPYKASVWVRQNSGSNQTFVLAIIRQSPLGAEGSPGSSYMASETQVIPTGVWTQISFPFVADVQEVHFYVTWMYTGAFDNALHPSPTYFVDDAQLFEGLPTTTVGDILLQIYDDATVNHPPRFVWEDEADTGTAWLIPDFDEVNDSAGVPWDNSEIAIRLTMRMSYSQIMAEFATSFGYEYRVVPDPGNDGKWLWQVYNPGTMSNDLTVTPGPAILGGSSDTTRSVRRFHPNATDNLIEGVGRVTGRARDTDLMNALGRIEGATLNREATTEDGTMSAAEEAVTTQLIAGRSYMYELVDPDTEPLTDFLIGDLLYIIDPPEVPEATSRFVNLVVTVTPQTVSWETQFGAASITNPDAAVADSVAQLLAKFEYPDELGGGGSFTLGGEAGMITVGVAAFDASATSKAKADFICTGATDDQVIMTALEICHQAGGGTVWLSEGTFNVDGDVIIVGFSQSYPVPMTLRGMGYGTIVEFTGFTNWVIFVAPDCKLLDMKIEADSG